MVFIQKDVTYMEKQLIILMGVQGSGKSTFCQRYFKDGYVRINLDMLKTRHREKLLINECLHDGRSYVVDNTNPTKADRERYIPQAKAKGYKVVGYFMESKLQVCIARNEQRKGEEKIPPQAIAATSNKLEMPQYAEGFDELYFVGNNGNGFEISQWRE